MGSVAHATSQWNICSPQVPHRHGNRCAHQGQVTNAASPALKMWVTVCLETKACIDGIQKWCVWGNVLSRVRQLSAWSDTMFHLSYRVLNLSNSSRTAHSAFVGAYRGHDWRIEAVHLSVSLWATAFWEQDDTQLLKDGPEKTKRPQLTVTNGTFL